MKEENVSHCYKKHLSVMRGWLNGRRYYKAAQALELAKKHHTGLRKDGVTPSFFHQLRIAEYLHTLEGHFLFPEETLAVAFLHDLVEDHHDRVSPIDIKNHFGERIYNSVMNITKKIGINKVPYPVYFERMSQDPIASLVKGADRIDNVQSMQGVFSEQKQKDYCKEVNTYFLPMLKKARRLFPQQVGAYENIKYMLKNQLELISYVHK